MWDREWGRERNSRDAMDSPLPQSPILWPAVSPDDRPLRPDDSGPMITAGIRPAKPRRPSRENDR